VVSALAALLPVIPACGAGDSDVGLGGAVSDGDYSPGGAYESMLEGDSIVGGWDVPEAEEEPSLFSGWRL